MQAVVEVVERVNIHYLLHTVTLQVGVVMALRVATEAMEIMQMMLNLICGMMVGQAEAAVQQVEVVEAMAEDADM